MSLGNVTISVEEYFELVKAQAQLEALECGGVDNWSGYELAWEDEFGEETEFSELEDYSIDKFVEAYQIKVEK